MRRFANEYPEFYHELKNFSQFSTVKIQKRLWLDNAFQSSAETCVIG